MASRRWVDVCLLSTAFRDIYGNVVKRQFSGGGGGGRGRCALSTTLTFRYASFPRAGVLFLPKKKKKQQPVQRNEEKKGRDRIASGRNARKPNPRWTLKQFIL